MPRSRTRRNPRCHLRCPHRKPTLKIRSTSSLSTHRAGTSLILPACLYPTYAPAMTAFGIVLIALGAVTVWPLSVIGAVIFVLAIAKWIGELLHD